MSIFSVFTIPLFFILKGKCCLNQFLIPVGSPLYILEISCNLGAEFPPPPVAINTCPRSTSTQKCPKSVLTIAVFWVPPNPRSDLLNSKGLCENTPDVPWIDVWGVILFMLSTALNIANMFSNRTNICEDSTSFMSFNLPLSVENCQKLLGLYINHGSVKLY